MLRIYYLIFSLLFICASVSSQITLSLEDKKIYLNGQELTEQPDKQILDQLVKEKSRTGYIVSSYDPITKGKSDVKRKAYNYKSKGLYIHYYTQEKGIYSITLIMRSSHKNPLKDNQVRFQNTFRDGNIVLDTTSTLEKTIALIGEKKLKWTGVNPFLKKDLPFLVYAKDNLLIEITFDKQTQLIQQVYIRR